MNFIENRPSSFRTAPGSLFLQESINKKAGSGNGTEVPPSGALLYFPLCLFKIQNPSRKKIDPG